MVRPGHRRASRAKWHVVHGTRPRKNPKSCVIERVRECEIKDVAFLCHTSFMANPSDSVDGFSINVKKTHTKIINISLGRTKAGSVPSSPRVMGKFFSKRPTPSTLGNDNTLQRWESLDNIALSSVKKIDDVPYRCSSVEHVNTENCHTKM